MFSWHHRSVAAVHPGGAGTPRPAAELWEDPLESHEVPGGAERGEVHVQVHSVSDRTLVKERRAVPEVLLVSNRPGSVETRLDSSQSRLVLSPLSRKFKLVKKRTYLFFLRSERVL